MAIDHPDARVGRWLSAAAQGLQSPPRHVSTLIQHAALMKFAAANCRQVLWVSELNKEFEELHLSFLDGRRAKLHRIHDETIVECSDPVTGDELIRILQS